MDLSETIAPKSDQLNAVDLLAGEVTVTIQDVQPGKNYQDQPVDMFLAEYPGRPYRPSLTMRRLLVEAWGKHASEYSGRRMTIYRNPEITFGSDKVGGIEISHMSNLQQPAEVTLSVGRNKRRTFRVEPLAEQQIDWQAHIEQAQGDTDRLRQLWQHASQRSAGQEILDQIAAQAQQAQHEGEQA